jgi:hypothetical protein
VTRDDITMQLDALVVDDLDVDVPAGMPFMKNNDVSLHPSRNLIVIKNTSIKYGYLHQQRPSSSVRRSQVDLIRSPVKAAVYPGEYIELCIPPYLSDCEVAIEPREDCNQDHGKFRPSVMRAVGNKIRLVNDSTEMLSIRKHSHVCQVCPITDQIKKIFLLYQNCDIRRTLNRLA